MQVILVQCSQRLIGDKLRKSRMFLNDTNGSKKARMSKSQMKTILITFLDIKGIVHFELIPQGQTVNRAYYC